MTLHISVRGEAEVRRVAVADAVAKAADYADALGFPAPAQVQISDPGMDHDRRYLSAKHALAMEADTGEPAISLVPEEIRIEVVVEAEFAAE